MIIHLPGKNFTGFRSFDDLLQVVLSSAKFIIFATFSGKKINVQKYLKKTDWYWYELKFYRLNYR